MVYYEIKTDDIKSNIKTVLQTAGVPVWGVLKYDGYGIGLIELARLLREEGVSRFAVSDCVSLTRLRGEGFEAEDILLLSPQPTEEEIETVIDSRGIFSVGSLEYAERINKAAEKRNVCAYAHAAVDTGMGRFGFFPGNIDGIKKLYTDFENIKVTGIFSHLSSAFSDKTEAAKGQLERFCHVLRQLENAGIDRGMAHIANSPALFRFPEMRLDAVRAGSALVGRVSGVNAGSVGLKRVGCLVATAAEIKDYPKGYNIGYGNGFKVKRPFRGAILSAGQWAGIPARGIRQTLTGKYPIAYAGGREAPIICASGEGHSVVDVTGLDVHVGDPVRIDINPLHLNSTVIKRFI